MKNTLLGILIGTLLTPLIAFALNVSVPQAPGANYVLLSTTTGMYNYVSTSSLGISQDLSSYVTHLYASTTFPSFTYATATYMTYSYASSTYASTSYVIATYLPLSASTSLSYIPLSASTSLAYIPSASSSLYVPYSNATGGVNLNNNYLSNVATLSVGTTSTSSIVMIQGTTTQPLLNVMSSTSASALYVSNTGTVEMGTTTAVAVVPNSTNLIIQGGIESIGTSGNGKGGIAQFGVQGNNLMPEINLGSISSLNSLYIENNGYWYITTTGASTNLSLGANGATSSLVINASTNNIGIGNTTPQQALTLTSGDNFAVNLSTPGTPTIASSTTGGTLAAQAYWFRVTASDGVGNTTPSSEVTATTTGSTGSITLTIGAVTGASSYNIYFSTTTAGGENAYISTTTTTFVFATSTVYTSGTVPTVTTAYVNKISASGNSWLDGGNVGIGTTNPGALLHISGDNSSAPDLLIGTGANVNNYIGFANSRGMIGYAANNVLIQGGVGKGVQFGTNNGTFGNNVLMYLSSAGGVSIGSTYVGTDAGANNMIIQGNVGIGTTSPTNLLTVVSASSTASTTVAFGSAYSSSTAPAIICQWNGLSYTKAWFSPNSVTEMLSTSTTCN